MVAPAQSAEVEKRPGIAGAHPHAEEDVAQEVARHQHRVLHRHGRRAPLPTALGNVGQSLESGGARATRVTASGGARATADPFANQTIVRTGIGFSYN